MTIGVVIVDDHPLALAGLRPSLEREGDIQIIGEAPSLRAARPYLGDPRVDVILLDIRLPDGNGMTLLRELDALEDPPAIVCLSVDMSTEYVNAAIALGASGYVQKTAGFAAIIGAVRTAAAGGLAFTVEQLRDSRRAPWQPLTPREHDIIAGVMAGRSNDELSVDLGLARKTVENYLARLFVRFGVGSRTELGILAEREQLLGLPTGRRHRWKSWQPSRPPRGEGR